MAITRCCGCFVLLIDYERPGFPSWLGGRAYRAAASWQVEPRDTKRVSGRMSKRTYCARWRIDVRGKMAVKNLGLLRPVFFWRRSVEAYPHRLALPFLQTFECAQKSCATTKAVVLLACAAPSRTIDNMPFGPGPALSIFWMRCPSDLGGCIE